MTSAASDDTTIGTPGFCSDCPYWASGRQQCRRNPPQAGMGFNKVWPQTLELDWCGEHPARKPLKGGRPAAVRDRGDPETVAVRRGRIAVA